MSPRRWTFIIVPPGPGSPTRRIALRGRSLATAGTLILAAIAASGLWAAADSSNAAFTADRLAEAQRSLLALHDTVQSLRAITLAEEARGRPPVDMILPVAGHITSRFTRSRFHPLLQIFREHRGVDLGARAGTHIVAPAAGTVRSIGWHFGYGLTVELEHSGGIRTRFAHCRVALVHVGDQVTGGQAIATVGATGLATGPHVHFEVLVHGQPVDPIKFIASTQNSTTSLADRAHAGEDR
jgi:murein DD-endopeptidase MepM/ murein hydrolase activator NlpD